MTDIVEFLTARLDEDEALADDAKNQLSGAWKCIERSNGALKVTDELGYSVIEGADIESAPYFTGPHIARHDPARVLAEVKAKRAIVARHTSGVIRTYQCGNRDHIQDWQCERAAEPYEETRYCEICDSRDGCVELQELAAVHDAHPDYKQEWSVE